MTSPEIRELVELGASLARSNGVKPWVRVNKNTLTRFATTLETLADEVRRLRAIISQLGYCTPEASLEFMELIPAEIRAKFAALGQSSPAGED